ncbi:isoleucyl-tRNA synthetase [Pedobacter frigiditerrae]|uniref:Isoleucyl-tRNA synthetase n=1 Tax=Pedobacter frigiditerrae TaxID=2530452 RepID=A0A4R0N0J1_9SPHI|nr:isoleucyl-tRNA synthetase [Pedobacter frigiditerrae]TCC93238.1 isoleucyl-tRNA synthetase [Pedobacter frigiditerrae]
MIKVLRLKKGVIAIVLGIILLIVAQVMSSKHIDGSNVVLGFSGGFLILGSLIFLYPILFAKKVDNEGEEVELKPAAKEPLDGENVA